MEVIQYGQDLHLGHVVAKLRKLKPVGSGKGNVRSVQAMQTTHDGQILFSKQPIIAKYC